MADVKITGDSSMQEVLDAFPSAQRALFRKYHIGGCSSCGYEPEEKLANVARNHQVENVQEVIDFILASDDADKKLMISVKEVDAARKAGKALRLLDVRTPDEFEAASIAGSEPFTREVNEQMANWPQDTSIVFICHSGSRSMDAASFFAGHGFSDVRSMQGGIDAWSREIDPSVPRYEVERDRSTRMGVIRPLNASLPL